MNERRFLGGGDVAAFRSELLRWNRQINLVTRRDTARRVNDLIHQCDEAFSVLLAHEKGRDQELSDQALLYCDLGAGGGLPGFIWHGRLRRETRQLQSWLVEPREKRAWFLQRAARLHGKDAYGVLQGRWGEVVAGALIPATAAWVSLKALRMTDPEVLHGLEALGGPGATLPGRVVIARFHPAGTEWSPELVTELAFAAPGDFLGRWQGCGAGFLPVAGGDHEPASLVVSTYVSCNS